MNGHFENNHKTKEIQNSDEEDSNNYNKDNDNVIELNSIEINEKIKINGETNGGEKIEKTNRETEHKKDSEKVHDRHVVFDLNVKNAENKDDITLKINEPIKDIFNNNELDVISEEKEIQNNEDIDYIETEEKPLSLKDKETNERTFKKLQSSKEISRIPSFLKVERLKSFQEISKLPSIMKKHNTVQFNLDDNNIPKALASYRSVRSKKSNKSFTNLANNLNPLNLNIPSFNEHHHHRLHHNTDDDDDPIRIPSHLSVRSTRTVRSDITEKEEEDLKMKTVNLFFQMINISLGYFLYGYETGVFNQIQENIAFDLEWKAEDKTTFLSLVSVMISIGATFGAIITGKIANIIGRKLCYIILDVILIVGTGITLFTNTYSMIVGRFVSGYAVGGYVTLVPMTMKETVPVRFEGYGTAMYNISYNIGMLFAFSLGINIPPIDKPDLVWWRVCFGLPIAFALINMILLLTQYKLDTPKHLLEKGDREGAIESFKYTYENDNDIEGLILTLEEHLKKKELSEEITYGVVLGPRFSKQLFIGGLLMIVYQGTCLGIFNYYSTKVFARTMTYKEANLFTTIQGVCRFAGSILSIFIFGRVPNKIIAMVGFSVICGCLFAISICDIFDILEPQNYIILFHYLVFGATAMSAYKINAEILPDIGIGIASLVHWIMNCIVVLALPFMLISVLAFKWTIMLYASVMLICIILIGIFYKDAHGLSLDEVENLYKTWF